MKIRDLSDYIKQKTNSDVEYNSQLKLLTKADLLLTKLYGEFDDPDGYLKGELIKLSSFAEDSDDQVFYEFLQNAKDANGTGLWVFMDKKLGVIILNDGEPFHTNPNTTDGSLFSFLGKGKGGKFKDSSKSGEKGMGSKLLYNMLVPYNSSGNLSGMSERLAEALSEDQIGPILFSWSNQDINALRRILNVTDISDIRIADSESPILCKLFLSYFPALPNQSLNYLDKNVIPFGQLEFNQFKDCLSEALKFFKNDELFYSPGSIIYIPAHESTIEKLEGGLVEICKGLAQSLSVLSIDGSLNNVKRVVFGDVKIEKEIFQSIPITVKSDGVEINASIVFSLTRNEKQKVLPNIFTDYFPISKEIHGLGYILRCKKFNILDNRQKLRKNESNKFVAFANKLIESWDQIPDSSYSPFLGSLAISLDPKEGEEILLFHEIVKGHAINQIQTNQSDIPRAKADEVIALPSGFEKMNISDLLLGKYPLHPRLYEYYDDGLDKWGVEVFSLSRLFHDAGVEKARKFVENSDEYLNIVKQLELENEANYLFEIPFVPTSSGYLSIKEFCEKQDTFLLFPQNQFGSFKKHCQKENVPITFSNGVDKFLNLEYYPNVTSLIETKWNTEKTFGRFIEFFKNEEISFSQELKNHSLSDLYSFDKEEFASWVSDEYAYFSNRKGDSDLLIGGTIGNDLNDEFFNDWKLPVEQELSILKSFQAKANGVWEIVSSDRTYLTNKIGKLKETDVIKPVLLQLLDSFKERSNKKNDDVFFSSQDKLALTYDDLWEDFGKKIFHEGFENLTEEEYKSVSKLFSKFGYKLPNSDLLAAYSPKEFQKLFEVKSLQNLSLEWGTISSDEILLLKKLSEIEGCKFFDLFTLKQSGVSSFEIKSNNESSRQFFNSPTEVSEFLVEQNQYFELPESLLNYFTVKDGLWDVSSEQFKLELLDEFGSEQVFLILFQGASDILKSSYIENIELIEINSNDQQILKENSFEVRFVSAFANDETLLAKVKEKIQIDGQTISHDGYNATVNINSHSYILSELLDDQEGALDRMNKATKLFSTLNPRLREKFLGLDDKPLCDIKDEILEMDKGKPVQVAFLIDYLDQREAEDFELVLDELPNFSGIDVKELFSEFKNRNINWKKYWKNEWFGINPEYQIIPNQVDLWLESEIIAKSLLEWSNKSDDNLKYLAAHLDSQNHVQKSESFRFSMNLGKVLDDIYLPKKLWSRTLEWGLPREVVFFEKEGEKLWTIIENQGLWEDYLVSYTSWGTGDERTLRLSNVGSPIKYYFDRTLHFEYLLMSELSPESVSILSTSSSSKTRKIAEKLNLEKLSIEIRAKGELPDKIEWHAGYYNSWKDNRPPNHFTYRIYTVNKVIESSAVIMKGGEPFLEINSVKDEFRLRVKKEASRRDIFIYLKDSEILSLKYLEEFQNDLFVGESESKDLVRLFSLANEFQEEALSSLKSRGIIDEDFNPISSPNTSNNDSNTKTNGNVYLEGFENLKDPQLLLDNWDLIRQLIEKFGNDLGKKLQAALENETDDSKPNKLSGFIGEQLAREWFEKNYQKDATWLGDRHLAYDIILGNNELVEIKTKIKTLYDELVGGSGTTAVYLRQSQLNFIEETKDKQYYLGLISLEDLGIRGNYYEWNEVWGGEVTIQISLQEEIKNFAKDFMNDEKNMELFSNTIRFIFMKNGKDQISSIELI
jgi:hypothetical protein